MSDNGGYLDERRIELRESFARDLTQHLYHSLRSINSAFRFFRVDTPIVSKIAHIDGIKIDETVSIRSNTVHLHYEACLKIINPSAKIKQRLPIVLWEHAKSLKKTTKGIIERQYLEYNVLHSLTTATSYFGTILNACKEVLNRFCGNIKIVEKQQGNLLLISDRTSEELGTITNRTDFPGGKNIHVAIDTDSCATAHLTNVE